MRPRWLQRAAELDGCYLAAVAGWILAEVKRAARSRRPADPLASRRSFIEASAEDVGDTTTPERGAAELTYVLTAGEKIAGRWPLRDLVRFQKRRLIKARGERFAERLWIAIRRRRWAERDG